MPVISEARVTIRDARTSDLQAVIALDTADTGLEKPDYWQDIFARYVENARPTRFFLIADTPHDATPSMIGFIVGEVRDWEFGSPPSGWVFAIHVEPKCRERGVGSLLLEEICNRFRSIGINTLRTMISRQDTLNLSFFRSQGLMGGPYIELEKRLT
jgi:ribosomal protein S18 acetylase RimI-like enzyme